MIPATDQDIYRGTIFLNPGGPGGSGVDFLERVGTNISRIVGPSFDVLSFDPRGIGRTTPLASCFETASQRAIWATQEGHQLIDASDESLGIIHARAEVLAERCKEQLGGEWGIGRFATTPYVARDMLEITQSLGQEQLQYWGFVRLLSMSSLRIPLSLPLPFSELWQYPRTVLRGHVPGQGQARRS